MNNNDQKKQGDQFSNPASYQYNLPQYQFVSNINPNIKNQPVKNINYTSSVHPQERFYPSNISQYQPNHPNHPSHPNSFYQSSYFPAQNFSQNSFHPNYGYSSLIPSSQNYTHSNQNCEKNQSTLAYNTPNFDKSIKYVSNNALKPESKHFQRKKPELRKEFSESNKNQNSRKSRNSSPSDQSSSSSEGSSEEVFMKRKIITKRKDPILDNPEEIKRWIQARKRNYPTRQTTEEKKEKLNDNLELSILEKKIRQKIMLTNSDPRTMLKKMRSIEMLRRFILNPKKGEWKQSNVKQSMREPEIIHEMKEKEIEKEKELISGKEIDDEGELIQKEEVGVMKKCQEQEQAEAFKDQQSSEGEADEVPIKQKIQQNIPQDLLSMKSTSQKLHQTLPKHLMSEKKVQVCPEETTAEMIIKHLQSKQQEDTSFLGSLLDYKSNSLNYKYHCQTLETNMMMEDIFKESTVMLQAIRFIVQNKFLEESQL